jgi:hypothetical protein
MDESLAADVRRLLDIEAIKQLKARYFRVVDTKQWKEFGEVFTADAHLDADGNQRDGRDAIVALVSGGPEGMSSVHHGHMPEIEITGPDAARGIWRLFDYLEFPSSGAPEGFTGYGWYDEEYVRDDGVWRIARLHITRQRVDPLAGGFPAVWRGVEGVVE